MRPTLSPQLFPIPHPIRHLVRQRVSELMGEHTHLPAMVGFVRKHVTQHFRANRPRPSPAVSAKRLDAASRAAKGFSEHVRAASGALGQSRTGLLRRAVRAVELWWNLQVRSCKPDPLGADIVHVGEDRRNGAGLAGRFGSPSGRVKMFDKNLVDAIIDSKDLNCGSAELSLNLGLTRGHGSHSLTYDTSGPSAPRKVSRLGRRRQSLRGRLRKGPFLKHWPVCSCWTALKGWGKRPLWRCWASWS
jgi:hypothetical protein